MAQRTTRDRVAQPRRSLSGASSGQRAFTLLEMLLVITIIMILAGLVLGGINLAIRKAELNQARTTAFQLATALKSYQSEYGTWPSNLPARGQTSAALLQVLTAEDGVNNPRRAVFYTPNARRLSNTQYSDPWGSAYQYLWDSNYLGRVTLNGQQIPTSVAVWSYGPKGVNSPTNEWVRAW